MELLEQLAFDATRDILEKNLHIFHEDIKDKRILFIYDLDSPLSRLISAWYIAHLEKLPNAEIILFEEEKKEELKAKILELWKYDTNILVQTTNFRLEKFRIRMSLQQRDAAGIEHNHLWYMKESEIENYLRSISYKTPEFQKISDNLKNTIEWADTLKVVSKDWKEVNISWGFEEMMQNTGNFWLLNRYATYPVWENFTESKIFENVNGELYLYAFPGMDFQVRFCEPFLVKIEKSILTCDDPNAPEEFMELLEKIRADEGEVMVRELGFWINDEISPTKTLSDVSAYERMMGFHLSLGKKHNIYRRKIHKDILQKYHIDVFPVTHQIFADEKIIFENGKFL